MEQELRAVSDNFLTRIKRLHALEELKRELPLTDMAGVAHEVETLTREILEWAVRQSELAEKAAASDLTDARPIAIVPPRALAVVLAEWRAAERRLESEQPATAAYESARAEVDVLRDETHAPTRCRARRIET